MKTPFNSTILKLSTLVRLAGEIERENRVSIRATMNEMWARLAQVAGHCSTKSEAKVAIAEGVYQISL